MDMKRILQAMDSVSTSPVVGADSMAKFLSIVDKNANTQVLTEASNPHKVSLPVQMAMQHYQTKTPAPVLERKTSLINKYFTEVEQEFATEKNQKRSLINQYAQTIAERVLMKESVLKDKDDLKAKRKSLQDIQLDKDTHKDPELKAELIRRKAALEKEAKAKGLSENEIAGHSMGFTGGNGPGMGNYVVDETPLDFDKENPVASTIHSHKGVNPSSIEARIMRARGQLRELAKSAESNELVVWESIARHFPELAMNIEQIQHGIEELAKIRKGGGRRVHNIPKHIGETVMAPIKPATPKAIKPKKKTSTCRTGQVQTGMQTKDGKIVPKCSIK
jgi:phosphopantetheinyl transferase (holo-ACP synthase)